MSFAMTRAGVHAPSFASAKTSVRGRAVVARTANARRILKNSTRGAIVVGAALRHDDPNEARLNAWFGANALPGRNPLPPSPAFGSRDSITPDDQCTAVAFEVNLDRISPGSFCSCAVRPATAGRGEDFDVVVTVALPGDIYIHWGLGGEDAKGNITHQPWTAPPDEILPAGSARIESWGGGNAVRTQIAGARGQSNELVVPLPTRPDSGFAFVIYDGERQCYYDDGGKPFFLNSALAKATAAAAAKAAKEAASGQTDRLRAMAEADGGVAAAEYANKSLTDPNAQQSGGFFSKHPTTAPPAPAPAPAPAPTPAPAPAPAPAPVPDLAAGGDRGAYDRALKEESNPFNNTVGIPAGTTPYERCVSDPNNPFRGYAEKLAAERLAAAATMATAAPPAPAPMFVPPAPAPAPTPAFETAAPTSMPAFGGSSSSVVSSGGGGGGGGWGAASAGSYDAASFEEPDVGGGGGGGDGSVVTTRTINLSTETGSSTGVCNVSITNHYPPRVTLSCTAGGAAAGHPLLLHWGVSDRQGGTWFSPYDLLEDVPSGSRAPDAQSCESALTNGSRTIEFAPVRGDISCMTMLIRTENCQEWLRQSDGGDVFIDVSEALAASGGPGAGAGASPAAAAPPQQQHHDPPPPPPPQQQQHHHHEEKRAPPPPPPPPPQDDGGDHMALLSNWRGSAVELKGHREHNKDRHNQWNVDNLPDAARRIVEGDRDSPSWRQKLQALEGVLCFDDPGAMDMDALGYGAIYLFWVGVGAIACVEDGGHYRPNHHAKAAQHMYESIERVEKHHAGNGHVRALVRRLHPRLPAFTAEFTQQVPLTRIRDIAHGKGDRDGKCRDVRAEIKHTIQNKLHRCAGPEDLVATEAMLAKLTAPGTDYPEEFIEEFRIFHRELKDFFNASTVTDRLDKLQNEGPVPGEVSNACNAFVTAKYAVDALGANADGGVLLAALEDALVQLCAARRVIDREVTDGGLSSGSADQRQQWRLAEIGLEDYAFVLLSRGINALGAESDPPKSEMNGQEMRAALKFLAAASDACALSAGGGNGEEFAHIAHEANELATAGPDGTPPTGEDGALRVRAVAERARRAAEDYCALLSELFDGRAETLGSSLGIDRGTIEVFTEGQIRASVVFQSAKLASHLLRAARKATGEAGWDCLVPGEVVGAKLVPVRRLDPTDPAIAALTAANPAVLLVQAADGDEEVSTCGPGVAGILLCHALPHLSHLALRARQAKVPLVAIEDAGLVNHALSLQSAPGVKFVAQPSNISLDADEGGYVAPGGVGLGGVVDAAVAAAPAAALVADFGRAGHVLPLANLGQLPWDEGVGQCGSKATSCAVLSALALDPNAGFNAPPGAVIPFGSMEHAALAMGVGDRLKALIDRLEQVVNDPSETAAACVECQALVKQLRPSNEAMHALSQSFAPGAKVMVRSSGNAEDLAGLSAAGLYDSVSNVDPSRIDVLGQAVADVWASLYTPRAVGSRAAAGVGQRGAAMAVLVQQMLVPEVSFILMTRHPMTNDPNVAYAELALGHGETLASGSVRGTPWRVSMDRQNPGSAQVHAVSSFGSALVPDVDGDGTLKSATVNCASHWLTVDDQKRAQLAGRLVNAGGFIESRLGGNAGPGGSPLPQDVEGCLTPDGALWIVQARPQP